MTAFEYVAVPEAVTAPETQTADPATDRPAEKTGLLHRELTQSHIKRPQLMHLSRQLAAFVRAGVPILDAIQVLGDESEDRAVQRVMSAIGADLRAGATLGQAFERHPKDFPAFYRGILRSAEFTGRLDVVLDQLSSYIERDLESRRKVKSAVTYPAVVLATSAATVVVLSVYVLPKFKSFFANFGATLPAPTRALMAITAFVSATWWIGLVLLALLVGGLVAAGRTDRGRYVRDRVVLRLPVVGDTVRHMLVERYCRVLGSMMAGGVTLTEALSVASDSLHNVVFTRGLRAAYAEMLEGGGLAGPIQRTRLFPDTATQMIRVGEETGSLEPQLAVAASYFERELDHKVKRMTALLEPAVVVVAGLIVGFVAIALVSAMYGIFHQVRV